jgi:hypothetical protein
MESLFWKFLAAAFGLAASFVLPLIPYLAAIFTLVAVDLYTGIEAAKHRGENIRSHPLKRTIGKLRDYFLVVLLSEMMVKVFFQGIPLAESVTFVSASFIGVIEFKSNLENISVTTGVDLWERIKDLFPKHGKRKRGSEETSETDRGSE